MIVRRKDLPPFRCIVLLLLLTVCLSWSGMVSVAAAQDIPASVGADAPTAEAIDTAEGQGIGQTAAAPEEAVAAASLPRNLSPWNMFLNADWVVKTVMIGLALASVLTWTVFVAKTLELRRLGLAVRAASASLEAARSLGDVDERPEHQSGVSAALLAATSAELRLSADAPEKEGIKERVASRLSRIEAATARRMTIGTGLLATVGATSPFVGLFGTVWGIMNSFIGISQAQTTNLAVVAPGIAEALLATALGLVAAIPAVVIYNHFSRQIAGVKARVSDMSAATLRLLSRDLDRGVEPKAAKLKAVE